MRESLAAYQQMRQAIQTELAERNRIHKNKMATLTASRAAMGPAAAESPKPLALLAHGDSWFDYPLDGNGISLSDTDIVAQLGGMGSPNPLIQNISHFGDATTEEMSLPKQQNLIQSIQDKDNWAEEGKPDAILFSGGGDDIAGNQFCIFLDYAGAGASGLNSSRFQGVLDMVKASYNDLFAFRDKLAPGVPIFAHCYDFPTPNGVHPICSGPWLKPSIDFSGWSVTQGTAIVHQALLEFRALLIDLAADPDNLFTMVDTQGVLDPADWANELHPHPPGFKKLAQKYVEALRAHFPGRI